MKIDFIEYGTNESQEDIEKRSIIFTNVILITLWFVFVFDFTLDLSTRKITRDVMMAQWLNLFMICYCSFSIFLNKKSFTLLSRILLLIIWPVVILVIPTVSYHTPNHFYLAYPLAVIFHGFLIQITLPKKVYPIPFWTFMVLNMLIVFTTLDVLTFFDDNLNTQSLFANNESYFRNILYYGLGLNLILGYLLELLNAKINEIESRKLLLQNRTIELEKANNELKEFTHILSHELKSPLKGIHSLAEWIHTDNIQSLDGESAEHLKLLMAKVIRMNDLINGILEYSRLGYLSDKRSSVELKLVIDEVVEIVSIPKSIELKIDTTLPSLNISKVLMIQIFQNLISNAVKYIDKPNGTINIGCEAGEKPKFYVADNGPGIVKAHHERIFKIFKTLAPQLDNTNTGVGLTIVKKVVENHGGEIWLESELGQGSTFYFTIDKQYLV